MNNKNTITQVGKMFITAGRWCNHVHESLVCSFNGPLQDTTMQSKLISCQCHKSQMLHNVGILWAFQFLPVSPATCPDLPFHCSNAYWDKNGLVFSFHTQSDSMLNVWLGDGNIITAISLTTNNFDYLDLTVWNALCMWNLHCLTFSSTVLKIFP